MNVCDIWLRRDFLLAQGIHPDEPACDHPADDCPELAVLNQTTPTEDPEEAS